MSCWFNSVAALAHCPHITFWRLFSCFIMELRSVLSFTFDATQEKWFHLILSLPPVYMQCSKSSASGHRWKDLSSHVWLNPRLFPIHFKASLQWEHLLSLPVGTLCLLSHRLRGYDTAVGPDGTGCKAKVNVITGQTPKLFSHQLTWLHHPRSVKAGMRWCVGADLWAGCCINLIGSTGCWLASTDVSTRHQQVWAAVRYPETLM